MNRAQQNTGAFIQRVLWLMACPAVFTASPSQAADPEIQVADQSLYGDCEDKALRAVKFLRSDIPNDPQLLAAISNCIRTAPLVEASCDYQLDREPILRQLFEDESLWHISCVDYDAPKSAEADVDIYGVEVRFDFEFVRDNTESRIASVLAHEVMHNMGFQHSATGVFYDLTVPEQVETCINSGGAPAAPPYPNYLDRSLCCVDGPLCITGLGCFNREDGCVNVTPSGEIDTAYPPAESSRLYCGTLFVREDGIMLDPLVQGDALICTSMVDPSGMSHP